MGNPKKITAVTHLAAAGMRIINRPLGTGTRLPMNLELGKQLFFPGAIK